MRSGFEQTILEALKGIKAKFWYEPFSVEYVITKKYIPDFVIYKGKNKKVKKPLTKNDLDGILLVEAKGFFKPSDRTKMLAVKKENPELDIRFLFQQNGFLYKKKKGQPRRTPDSEDIRYGDWCDKHGFPWAVGNEVPKEWIENG